MSSAICTSPPCMFPKAFCFTHQSKGFTGSPASRISAPFSHISSGSHEMSWGYLRLQQHFPGRQALNSLAVKSNFIKLIVYTTSHLERINYLGAWSWCSGGRDHSWLVMRDPHVACKSDSFGYPFRFPVSKLEVLVSERRVQHWGRINFSESEKMNRRKIKNEGERNLHIAILSRWEESVKL